MKKFRIYLYILNNKQCVFITFRAILSVFSSLYSPKRSENKIIITFNDHVVTCVNLIGAFNAEDWIFSCECCGLFLVSSRGTGTSGSDLKLRMMSESLHRD